VLLLHNRERLQCHCCRGCSGPICSAYSRLLYATTDTNLSVARKNCPRFDYNAFSFASYRKSLLTTFAPSCRSCKIRVRIDFRTTNAQFFCLPFTNQNHYLNTLFTTSMSPPNPHSKKHNKQLRWTWRKPPDKPKRPLSAYNLFFADVRRKLLEQRRGNGAPSHGLGFSNLARTVAKQWRVRRVCACI